MVVLVGGKELRESQKDLWSFLCQGCYNSQQPLRIL